MCSTNDLSRNLAQVKILFEKAAAIGAKVYIFVTFPMLNSRCHLFRPHAVSPCIVCLKVEGTTMFCGYVQSRVVLEDC